MINNSSGLIFKLVISKKNIYTNMSDTSLKYYVYCFFDPTKRINYEQPELDYCFIYEPFYIGKGKNKRIKAHFTPSCLRIKSFKNNKIKKIHECGLEVLTEILIDNLTEDQAYQKEQEMIAALGRRDKNHGSLTNLCDGGYGITNCQIPSKRKRVYQYNLLGKLISEYESISKAASDNNLILTDISKCCHAKQNTHGGFFWSFEKDKNKFEKDKRNRKVIQFDMNGNLIRKWDSVGQAALSLKLKSAIISRICNGDLISKNGTYFRYEEFEFPIMPRRKTNRRVIQIKGNEIINYCSVKEAAKSLKLSIKAIIARCKKSSVYDSLYLMYKDDYDKGIRKTIATKSNGEIQVFKIDDRNQILATYKSISEAAVAENISRKKLSSNLNKNKIKNYFYATICN
jgi:hypothetical protein